MRKFVFVHLPKTAGTSFVTAMKDKLGDEAVSPHFVASRLSPSDAARLDAFTVIAGHISWTDIEAYFADRLVLTILREPSDRCLSWYYYARKHTSNPNEDFRAARTYSVDEFFSLDPKTTFRNIFNRQTRQLGDHALNADVDLDRAFCRAQEVLRQAAWVGLQEHFASDLERLSATFPEFSGLSVAQANVNPDRIPLATAEDDLIGKISRYNEADNRLYSDWCGQCAETLWTTRT